MSKRYHTQIVKKDSVNKLFSSGSNFRNTMLLCNNKDIWKYNQYHTTIKSC